MKKIIALLVAVMVLCGANVVVTKHYIFAVAPKELPQNYSEKTSENLYNQWLKVSTVKTKEHVVNLTYLDDKDIKYLPFEVFKTAGNDYLKDINSIMEMTIPISGFKTSYSLKYSELGSKKICTSVEAKMKISHVDDYQAVKPKVEAIAKDINSRANSEREKITLLNSYLIENVTYDTSFGVNLPKDDLRVWESWGALNDGIAVCSGYVNAFAQICQAMEIPVISVVGYRDRKNPNDEKEIGHEWNEVYIEGRWMAVDVTSNDPVIVGGTMAEKAKNDKYGKDFLLVSQSYLKEHKYEWDEKKLAVAKKMVYPYLTVETEI